MITAGVEDLTPCAPRDLTTGSNAPVTNAEAIRNGADEGDLMARWFATSQHPERVAPKAEGPKPLTLHEAWARLADTPADCTEPERFDALVTEETARALRNTPLRPGLTWRCEGGLIFVRFDRTGASHPMRCPTSTDIGGKP